MRRRGPVCDYVTARQSHLSHWHPVLGWFSISLEPGQTPAGQPQSGTSSEQPGGARVALASTRVALVCALYQTACQTLSQLRIDILDGLCYGDLLLKPLWIFLNSTTVSAICVDCFRRSDE